MAEPQVSEAVANFFAQLGGIIVTALAVKLMHSTTEQPKLDLELYIQNYRGRTRFDRLFMIGRSSVPLCIDALKAAIAEAKRGRDVQRYKEAVECLAKAGPNEPEAVLDREWVEKTEKTNRMETTRLEAELRGYKNNLIKESVRMGNEDLGKHFEATGNLGGATEAYMRMRPDVSTTKHIVDLGKHLVSIALQTRDWAMATANLVKMTGNQNNEEEKGLNTFVKIAGGIAALGRDNLAEAATSFLQADASVPFDSYNTIASPNDVAAYGGLLALATMDRDKLQSGVLNNSTFRPFLELEPHIRRAINQFVGGRYSACLATLEAFRADYQLDVYLSRHVEFIYDEIRKKCIVQYLIPFSCVTLESMNAAFMAPGQSIEKELIALIQARILNARIDSIDGLVTTPSVNERSKMQAEALHAIRDYEKEAIERTRRMSLAIAGLEVKGNRKFAASMADQAEKVGLDETGA